MNNRKRSREYSPEVESIIGKLNTTHLPSSQVFPKRYRETLEEVLEEGDYGTITYTINLKNQREGLYKSYFPNGQIREMANYDKGERYGLIQQWFPDGRPFELYTMTFGLRNGAAITWFSSGMIRCYENYKDGSLDGSCIYYNEAGQKQIERSYSNNTIIKDEYFD